AQTRHGRLPACPTARDPPGFSTVGGPSLPYQLSRPVNCRTRGEFCDSWLVMIPVVESGILVPGMLNTLKKSMLNRRNIASRNRIALNAEAFMDHSMGASTY